MNFGDTLSGAEYLASIYGTEKDKVNCSFFFKVSGFHHIHLGQTKEVRFLVRLGVCSFDRL